MIVWFSRGGEDPFVEVGPNGFLFGRGRHAGLDLSGASNRVAVRHCSFWKIKGEYLVLDQQGSNGTFVGQEATADAADKPVPPGVILIEIDEPNGPMLLAIKQVNDATLNLAADWILLVNPNLPDGHIRVRFVPVADGDFNMDVRACRVRVVKTEEKKKK